MIFLQNGVFGLKKSILSAKKGNNLPNNTLFYT